jgi:lipoyl(octanoyl) transferase
MARQRDGKHTDPPGKQQAGHDKEGEPEPPPPLKPRIIERVHLIEGRQHPGQPGPLLWAHPSELVVVYHTALPRRARRRTKRHCVQRRERGKARKDSLCPHPGYAGGVRTGAELVFAEAGFGSRAVPYLDAWELQRRLHERRTGGEIPDTCLLLEHEPVYTAGKRTSALDRPLTDPGAPVIDVDRGGELTWHGPGQLVGYPVIKLPEPVDVLAYVRAIEDALIGVCAEFGVGAGRARGHSGVWVTGAAVPSEGRASERYLAAIGIRVARGVTMHGFALNCDCDLSWYDRIVPCGMRDVHVTTLSAEAGRRISVNDAAPAVKRHLTDAFGATDWRDVAGTGDLLESVPVP